LTRVAAGLTDGVRPLAARLVRELVVRLSFSW
jgi:hypothetical protein